MRKVESLLLSVLFFDENNRVLVSPQGTLPGVILDPVRGCANTNPSIQHSLVAKQARAPLSVPLGQNQHGSDRVSIAHALSAGLHWHRLRAMAHI
jgi:hypothetical protein